MLAITENNDRANRYRGAKACIRRLFRSVQAYDAIALYARYSSCSFEGQLQEQCCRINLTVAPWRVPHRHHESTAIRVNLVPSPMPFGS